MIDRKKRLEELRKKMKEHKIDALLVPMSDRFQNEYPDSSSKRIEWLSAFTGSVATIIVTIEKSVIFTNSIYEIQVKQQVDDKLFEIADMYETPISQWILENIKENTIVGYDSYLHTIDEIDKLKINLESKDIKLKALKSNPINEIWHNRPPEIETDVIIFPESIAGKSSSDKRKNIAKFLKEKSCDAAIITLSDSIAWLLNIRASDCPHVPVANSYAILYAPDGTLDWFISDKRISKEILEHLGKDIKIESPDDLERKINKLAGKTVLLDGITAPDWFRKKLQKANSCTINLKDPCIELKALKTPQEQQAMINAHIRDGAAVTKFLYWLENNSNSGITELDIDEKLFELRSAYPEFRGTSFDTIAGSGSNGAIVHYRVTKETNRKLVQNSLLLVDSGGQYIDGTTDITRTIAIGTPTKQMKENYTRVLKGHINLAMAHFPEGTTGAQLDSLARKPLWDADMDYGHGTGHGVGCYLSVHEKAAGISPRVTEAIKPSMIHSNEPGYYVEGEYGIRIESLILCKETGKINTNNKKMLEFETITMAPLDLRLIVMDMLNDEEKNWLKKYHKKISDNISPFLNESEKNWLEKSYMI